MSSTEPNTLGKLVQALVGLKALGMAGMVSLVLLCGGLVAGTGVGALLWSDAIWDEALDTVVAASPDVVDPSLDGSLVHVVGETSMTRPAVDATFSIGRDDALVLVRVVETWQWIETTETTASGAGSSRRTKLQRVYHQDWSEELHDSRQFERPDGHTNPTAVEHDKRIILGDGARLGAYALTPEVVEALPDLTMLTLLESEARGAPGQLIDNRIHLQDRPNGPELGDQRISYRVLSPGVLTVMGRQSGSEFRPWSGSASHPVLLAHPGELSATELVWEERRTGLLAGGAVAGVGGFLCCFALVPLLVLLCVGVLMLRGASRAFTESKQPML